ncbi:MAG: F0F1 ATP synthase subunit delta [Brachymonas sp.]|jgi:F-type H+-transporting ATPase subunit delta
MAELATIARPYAEALFASLGSADAAWLDAIAFVAAQNEMQQYAAHPKTQPADIANTLAAAAKVSLDSKAQNFVAALIDNKRLAALPEIALQFRALQNAGAGVSDAQIFSAFALDSQALSDTVAALEKRFARKLNAHVSLDPELIGGIRVVVGDEVLDTSVKARLEQMKTSLLA